jgi:translation elongation factor EF-Tu-like GTPase
MKKSIILASMMLLVLSSCSGGKKEDAAATAVFMVEDVFSLSEKGVVVAGEMQDGVIRVGDKISHYNKEGKKVFTCTVKAIEQPPRSDLQEASADAQRKFFAFAFKETKQKIDFVIGGYLTNGDLLKWKEKK